MVEMHRIYRRLRKYMLLFLLVCALGWGFTSYNTVFAGLALGALCGLFNFWNLIRKMESFGRKVEQGQKARSLGTLIRFASAILGVAIAISYPQYVSVGYTVIGLMIPYVLLLVDRIVFHLKNQ
jgi:ATP synthase protein I